MIFHLVVLGSAKTSRAASTALEFAHTLLNEQHQLARVFFYRDGVDIADKTSDHAEAWLNLASQHPTELVCCVASLQRRGLPNAEQLHKGFTIGGLGLYAEALIQADKVVHFG